MKNFEKYKTIEACNAAHKDWCDKHRGGADCHNEAEDKKPKPHQFFTWLKGNHRFIWCVLVSLILALMVIPVFIMCITLPFVSRIKELFCDIARDTIDNLSEMKRIWKAFADVKAVWNGKEVRDGE